MSDRELMETIWRALRMIEAAIAKKYGFGEYRSNEVRYDLSGQVEETHHGLDKFDK